jgi:hypothetical protein
VLIVGYRSGPCSIEIDLVVVPLQGEDRDVWKRAGHFLESYELYE